MCVKDRLESEMFEDLPVAKREGVCLSLCHCLNWFREMVGIDTPLCTVQDVCVCVCVCVCVSGVCLLGGV